MQRHHRLCRSAHRDHSGGVIGRCQERRQQGRHQLHQERRPGVGSKASRPGKHFCLQGGASTDSTQIAWFG